MRIATLELRNYRRFKELRIEFPDGVVGILGLNGAGKSTLIEAVGWAFFGNVEEAVRTSRESIKRAGAGQGENVYATVEFELGGAEYRITREMGGKSMTMKAELRTKERVLAEGDKPVGKMVEKLIGMDYKSFFTSVFARQKELNALQNARAGERKKAVLRMLRIDGVDSVIQLVRDDARAVKERIKGAMSALVDEDGREREGVLRERLPGLELAVKETSERLAASDAREKDALKAVDEARTKRDTLKKDVDAFNSSAKDLATKRTTVTELRKREEKVQQRVREAEVRVAKLPELEVAEKAWAAAVKMREALEAEKGRSDKAKHLREDITLIEKEEGKALEEASGLRQQLARPSDIQARTEEVDRLKVECEVKKAEISGRMGELKARAAERRQAADKDSRKHQEIRAAGQDGVCPTCDRVLGGSYTVLIQKLEADVASARKTADESDAVISGLQGDLVALDKREDALRKKRSGLEQENAKRKQLETSVESAEKQLARTRERLAQKRKDLEAVGEVRFSEQDYAAAKAEHDRLKPMHDEFVRIKSVQEDLGRARHELGEVGESISKNSLEEQAIRSMVDALEPKKNLYDAAIKDLDARSGVLNLAKDESRRHQSAKEKASAELDRTGRELENIARVKRTIESERKASDELAALEDIMVTFRDHLIGKVAPTLSEQTSKFMEAMTEGRYSGVSLDEDYEIQLDDQGVLHPIKRFSGGESDLANLAFRLAVSRIIADRTGASPINLLILDEIFGSLDPSRKRSVMTALGGLSSQFRQIFLITHIEDVKDLMNYVIRVEEREDGTSVATLV
jgi:exonuclease SbcC